MWRDCVSLWVWVCLWERERGLIRFRNRWMAFLSTTLWVQPKQGRCEFRYGEEGTVAFTHHHNIEPLQELRGHFPLFVVVVCCHVDSV